MDRVQLSMSRIMLVLLGLLPVSLGVVDCPEKCNGCQVGSLSCQNGGLSQLPEKLPPNINKIILIKHNFWDKTLRRANLSRYGTPNYVIRNLFIRECNIRAIEPRAFSNLKNLSSLDLSLNNLTDIVEDSFNGLSLSVLKLDKNRGLRLHANSFRGLRVQTLTITDCELKEISYETFKPISSGLKKLNLEKNLLKVIDQRFDILFRQLDTLSVQRNPLHCTCELRWLSRFFVYKAKHRSVKNAFDSENIDPICASPPDLVNISLHRIPDVAFHCEPPSLRTLDVEFVSATEGTLRCVAKGSPTMKVGWRRYVASLSSWNYEPSFSESSTLSIRRQNERDHYACLVTDRHGNVTANVKITWPPLPEPPVLPKPDNKPGIKENPDKERGEGADEREDNSETINHPVTSSENYFFRKQFTLLEMIGAVVGTFTATLAIFLLVYRCFVQVHKKSRKKGPYATYETAAYSDSQTYDLPQHPPYPPPPPPPPGGHFLDFKTQRKLYNNHV